MPLVVDNSNGASRLCRFLGMHDLSREEALQCVDIVDAIKKMLVQSEKGGSALPPHADALMKEIRMVPRGLRPSGHCSLSISVPRRAVNTRDPIKSV